MSFAWLNTNSSGGGASSHALTSSTPSKLPRCIPCICISVHATRPRQDAAARVLPGTLRFEDEPTRRGFSDKLYDALCTGTICDATVNAACSTKLTFKELRTCSAATQALTLLYEFMKKMITCGMGGCVLIYP